jgi:glycosyltransferase involved in cell wall biosynthesis
VTTSASTTATPLASSGLRLPRVRILMATYNGERFVRPQLDSLLGQDYSGIEVLIRDDGSSDGTIPILRAYADRHPHIRVIEGTNLGVVGNFFAMLREPAAGVEFTAFCGHDDVWHPTKISRAIGVLTRGEQTTPRAYCSRQRYIDADGNLLGHSAQPYRGLGFANALVENVVSGGTLVINRPLRDLVLETRDPSSALWEDWWIYLIASAFGEIHYDPFPALDYRKHSSNSVATTNGRSRWQRAQELLGAGSGGRGRLTRQAESFRDQYGERLDPAKQRVLARFLDDPASLLGRWTRAATCGVYRQERLHGLAVRVLMGLGRM